MYPASAGPKDDPGRRVILTRYVCPVCDGEGYGCVHCHGAGATSEVGGWEPHELRELPRPPAVMKRPCADCAFRPGSPEDEGAATIPRDAGDVFYCHAGAEVLNGHYVFPAMTADGRPVGAMVCAGWYDTALLGAEQPAKPYRELPTPCRGVSETGYGAEMATEPNDDDRLPVIDDDDPLRGMTRWTGVLAPLGVASRTGRTLSAAADGYVPTRALPLPIVASDPGSGVMHPAPLGLVESVHMEGGTVVAEGWAASGIFEGHPEGRHVGIALTNTAFTEGADGAMMINEWCITHVTLLDPDAEPDFPQAVIRPA